jgi:biopolymer transport protein ExbB
MRPLAELWAANLDFLELGGSVLVAILLATTLMWTLILDRIQYFRVRHRHEVAALVDQWHARADRSSWYAHQIRREIVSRVSIRLNRTVPTIKTLVALCPLLGLLGTVTGMIEVFEVIAMAGSGNPRAMASGVSRATIPTMAGMVAALSGYIPSVQLERRARAEEERLADLLSPEG